MTAKPLTAYPEVIQLYLGYHAGLGRLGVLSEDIYPLVRSNRAGEPQLIIAFRTPLRVGMAVGLLPPEIVSAEVVFPMLHNAALRWNTPILPEEEWQAVLDLFKRTVDLPAFVSAVTALIHGPLPVAVAQA